MLLKWSLVGAPLRFRVVTSVKALRPYSTIKLENTSDEWANAKPFKEIPGPNLLQVVRDYMPGGKLNKGTVMDMLHYYHDKYGTLCLMPGIFGRPPMVMSFDPKHTQLVFRTEGQWPIRRGLETFDYYRTKIRPEVFGEMGGLVSDQGETWYKMRTKVNPVMMQPRSVKSYVAPVDAISREFVRKMALLRDSRDEMPADFNNELSSWALESIGVVALDRRLGALDFEREPSTNALIKAVHNFFALSFELELKPSMWRYYKTKTYRELMASYDVMTETVMSHIDTAILRYENAEQNLTTTTTTTEASVLQRLLKIDKKYAVLMTFDMMFAGIDSTASAVANLLYLLALNPEKQEKLRNEIIQLLPNIDSEMTEESLNNSPYFRAAMKESMRIKPISAGNMRGAGENIVLNGYQIPKNTDILMGHVVLSSMDKYYENSAAFQPERFLRDDQGNIPQTENYNPFSFLPFGFGTRMCVGKRFAEMEIQLLVTRILREYRVEWHYGEMEYASAMITAPITPLRFRLVKLNE